jgi:hypothetical protein
MFALSARFIEHHEQREDSDPGDEYATRAETLVAQHSKLTSVIFVVYDSYAVRL